jgi:galactokinase
MVREAGPTCYDPGSTGPAEAPRVLPGDNPEARQRRANHVPAGPDSPMSLIPVELQAVRSFTETFGSRPTVLGSAPGRVELLGNHTDYNGGLVLAAAIDRFTAIAGRGSAGHSARFRSVDFREDLGFDFGPGPIEPGEPGSWGRYVRGVAWALQDDRGDFTSGVEAAIAGNVPLGAGLSSSASLQAALAVFLLRAGVVPESSADLDDPARLDLARVLQRSENAFVGVASGLLDQFTVLFGRAGHALTLDCRNLDFARVPLGSPPPAIVVCDTKTSRRLADGMYNRRRAECETIVTYFQNLRGVEAVRWLRDVSLDDLESAWDALDPVGRLRARHVLTENQRVTQGAEALRRGDLAEFGRLISASHASSRDDFGNSSQALDALIESAEESPGFLGGKLSGAGWAGCTVNLVDSDQAAAFASSVASSFARRTGTAPDVHVCRSADGAFGADWAAD